MESSLLVEPNSIGFLFILCVLVGGGLVAGIIWWIVAAALNVGKNETIDFDREMHEMANRIIDERNKRDGRK